MKNTKFISFYSYKGGSGRSTTCVNTIPHMIKEYGATPKNPIILVDADIESAGLTYYFKFHTKFTDEFENTIHTTKLLTKIDGTLEGIEGDYIFGKNLLYDAVSKSIIDDTMKFLKASYTLSKPDEKGKEDEIFNKVYLNRIETNMLNSILKCNLKKTNSETMTEDEYRIAVKYRINNLVDALSDTNRKFKDSNRLAAEKHKKIIDFLPAYSFCDISEYFGAAPGTVRFLGVNVNYQGIVPSNAVTEALEKMRKLCKANDVCAVVFDCSAGTQSTAHMLHLISDVIVYCLRPSLQFAYGTKMQLDKYEPALTESSNLKNKSMAVGSGNVNPSEDKKMVILVPTAVPKEEEYASLGEKSFETIKEIANIHKKHVDASFCNREDALNEVSLFKWREHILGVKNPPSEDEAVNKITERFENPDSMPEDAKHAYDVYKKLAACILKNSGGV